MALHRRTEGGSFRVTENNAVRVLDGDAPPPAEPAILLEDGTNLLLEDGTNLLLEE